MSTLTEISEFLQKGRAKSVRELVNRALEEGTPAKTILEEGLLPGMSVIGEKFRKNEVFVPEVLVAARAMNAGIEILKPHLAAGDNTSKGKAVIGTVKGDLHDIGKNLVKIMLEGKGLEVIDLGVDVSAEQFVTTAKEQGAQIICCSALLTTTMGEMKETVEEAKRQGIRDKVFIMVGGAPLTQAFCDQIGADCYTSDAASAASAALEHCQKSA
ncbi:MAG: corrinoid protein [Eubacteriales bacterium]|nr:corrinoid protein [Eubacteriales bacterium]